MSMAFLPADSSISEDTLKKMYEYSSGGCGIMYAINKKLYTTKGFWSKEQFISKVSKTLSLSVDVAIHCRQVTAGKISYKNCHPHSISSRLALMHSGTIYDSGCNRNSDCSDSRRLAEKYFRAFPKDFYLYDGVRSLLDMAISSSSSILLMDYYGNTIIVNEDEGEWDEDGVWFSSSYLARRQVYPLKPWQPISERRDDSAKIVEASGIVPFWNTRSWKQCDDCGIFCHEKHFQTEDVCIKCHERRLELATS